MNKKRAAIATRVSRIALCIGLSAGCGGDGNITSLEGPAPCGVGECSTGNLCVHYAGGIDGGPGDGEVLCVPVSSGCQVYDCEGAECPPCVRDLCEPLVDGYGISVMGRTMTCPGQ